MIFAQHNIWILIIYLLGIVTITIVTVFVSQKIINKNSNVSSLQNSINSQKTQLDSLETNVDSQKTQLDNLQNNVDSLKNNVDTLETQLNTQKTEIENSLKVGEDMTLIYNSSLDEPDGNQHQQWRLMNPKTCNNSVCELRFAGGISPQDPGGWYIHRPSQKS